MRWLTAWDTASPQPAREFQAPVLGLQLDRLPAQHQTRQANIEYFDSQLRSARGLGANAVRSVHNRSTENVASAIRVLTSAPHIAHYCGSAWTETPLQAATELRSESEDLTSRGRATDLQFHEC
jgi:hypothetical protein